MESLKAFFCFVVLVLWTRFQASYGLPNLIRIGGLFESDDEEQELAFRIAVDRINSEKTILPDSRIVAQVERIKPDDSFVATRKFCSLVGSGMAAVFGPQSDLTSMHVQSMCDAMEIPHIVTRWEHKMQRDEISVNLYPHPSALSKRAVQLIETLKWEKFYLVYEENEGIIRLQDFLMTAEASNWEYTIFQFPNTSSYRSVFWDIKRSIDRRNKKDSEIVYKIILDVPRKHLFQVLKAAQQVGMVTEKQRYLVTSLDLHTIDMEDFRHAKTTIIGFRLVNEEGEQYKNLLDEVNYRLVQRRNKPPINSLRTETALMYDAVNLFASALKEVDQAKQIDAFPSILCTSMTFMNTGSDGTSLINYMKNTKMKNGITRQVDFDAEGFRSQIILDVLYLTERGLEKVITLFPEDKKRLIHSLPSDFDSMLFEHQHFVVTTIKNDPFMMLKQSAKEMKGNDRYEGYTVDLLNRLTEILHFTFEIRLVGDGNYGSNKTGKWNGMIAEVMNGTARMAVADLTITSEREAAVDFTMPFMNTGISILFKRPTTKVTSLFSFLSPFSTEVWLYVMGAYTTISFVLFIVGRLSPYEWSNPHPCRQNDLVEENNFSLLNTMWFTIGSLMQQGSDLVASAPSTRTIASMWYFFNLIMISSYTANLAAFLTIEDIVYPIRNAEDLAKQTKIKYGCVKSGSTRGFFMKSNISTYKTMNVFMEKYEDQVLVKSNEEGKARVKEGNYAFLMESTSIAFIIERDCDLMQVGDLLDNKGYGIGVKKGDHKLRGWLSSGILKLQEDGDLHTFRERWWKQKKGGGQCTQVKSSAVKELDLGNVGGVFVVMLLGLLLATTVAVLEYLWFSRKLERTKEEPLWKLLLREMKFAATCGSSEKTAPKMKKSGETNKKNASSPPSYNALY